VYNGGCSYALTCLAERCHSPVYMPTWLSEKCLSLVYVIMWPSEKCLSLVEAHLAGAVKILLTSPCFLSGTIIRGTLKTPKSQLVTPISTKLQRPDGCD
jgi:hypothetical protein